MDTIKRVQDLMQARDMNLCVLAKKCGEGIRLEKDLTSVRCLESHWKNALSEV